MSVAHVIYNPVKNEKMSILKKQSRKEEIVNAITHGMGFLAGLVFVPFIIYLAYKNSGSMMIFGVSMFSFGLLITYFSSFMYHSVKTKKWKDRWRILDHISIFTLIGGTYFPVVLAYIPFEKGSIFLGIMWLIIFIGSILKIFYTGKYEVISIILYVFLGWMIIFLIKPLISATPVDVLWLLLAGGISYIVGIYFYVDKKIKFGHAIWHTFVLGGTTLHFIAIYFTLIG